MIAGYQGLWNFTDLGLSDLKFISVLIDKLAGTDTSEGSIILIVPVFMLPVCPTGHFQS